MHVAAAFFKNHQHALASTESCLDRFHYPVSKVIMDDKPVDNYLNIMGFVTVELHSEGEFANLAIDTHLNISLLTDLFEQISVMTLSASHYGS